MLRIPDVYDCITERVALSFIAPAAAKREPAATKRSPETSIAKLPASLATTPLTVTVLSGVICFFFS